MSKAKNKQAEVDHKALAEELDYDKLVDKTVEHIVLRLKKWLFVGIGGLLGIAFYLGIQMHGYRLHAKKMPKYIEKVNKLEKALAVMQKDAQLQAMQALLDKLKKGSPADKKQAAIGLASLRNSKAIGHIRQFLSSGDPALKDPKFAKTLMATLKYTHPKQTFKLVLPSKRGKQIKSGVFRPTILRIQPPTRR